MQKSSNFGSESDEKSTSEIGLTQEDIIACAIDVLHNESSAINRAAENIDTQFAQVVNLILNCRGKLVITGLGKSGHIGAKVAATLSSTGTPSLFLHASEAMHGDFGMLSDTDVVLALAFGGETREVLSVCQYAQELRVPVIALTGKIGSSLAKKADYYLDASIEAEADPLGLAPTASSTVALAIGDALAVALMRKRGFSRSHFARLHPGGSLGKTLSRVSNLMHKITEDVPLCLEANFHDVLGAVTANNFGIAAVVDSGHQLIGAVSDGDLRRALLDKGGLALEMKAKDLMGKGAKSISAQALAIDAISLMEDHRITTLFVCDQDNQVLGLVRLHDLLSAKIV